MSVEEARIEEARKELREHVALMVRYWGSEEGLSNVPPETSKLDALEGLAFSILVMLDGGAAVGPYAVRLLDDEGNEGPDLAGSLHEGMVWR